jgi:hypothetical protein
MLCSVCPVLRFAPQIPGRHVQDFAALDKPSISSPGSIEPLSARPQLLGFNGAFYLYPSLKQMTKQPTKTCRPHVLYLGQTLTRSLSSSGFDYLLALVKHLIQGTHKSGIMRNAENVLEQWKSSGDMSPEAVTLALLRFAQMQV